MSKAWMKVQRPRWANGFAGRSAATRSRFATSSWTTSTGSPGFVYAITGRSDSVEDLSRWSSSRWSAPSARLKAPEQFESWLFRLARNTCIDHLRRQKLRRIFIPFAPEHENVPRTRRFRRHRGARRPPPCPRPAPAEGPRPSRARPGGPQPRRDRETFKTSVAAVKARLHRAREQLRQHYNSDED
jgi:RNA polymerase sigma-70 factor, ECF subfamily